jgi:undecaprenyl-phosphate galactose phosphotransferase/putative colanic acid biosynthesis UDP-glucose lipid carrier transferase
LQGHPLLKGHPLNSSGRALKRAVDILFASFGLLALLPAFLLVALAIKIDSPGPVLFRQTRYGFNGKPFKILKFRSMSVLEDGPAIMQATTKDSCVTHVGSVIRRTSIDELPQLINVLLGEMSMVGPRPHAAAHDDYFLTRIENYAVRQRVKPGITGWAQVHGHRGETSTLNKMQKRVEYDIWYINNWSAWLDISILMRTLTEVARGNNAY